MSKWRPLAERIEALALDEAIELNDYPTDRGSIQRLRSGLGAVSPLIRFITRTLPTGGLRIIRAGTWGSAWRGVEYVNTATLYPVLLTKPARPTSMQRPWGFFLGLLWGTSLHVDAIQPQPRCKERGCVFPAFNDVRCSYHIKSFSLGMSMTDNSIDYDFIYGSKQHPNPLLYSGLPFQIDANDFTFEYKGQKRRDLGKWHGGLKAGLGRRGKGGKNKKGGDPLGDSLFFVTVYKHRRRYESMNLATERFTEEERQQLPDDDRRSRQGLRRDYASRTLVDES